MHWDDVGGLADSLALSDDCRGVRRNGRSLTLRSVSLGARGYVVAEVNVCGSHRLTRPVLAIELGGLTVVNDNWVLRHMAPLDATTTDGLEVVLDVLSREATRLAEAAEVLRHGQPDAFLHFAT